MKILVATRETQGKRKSDFNYIPEGEPVYPTLKLKNFTGGKKLCTQHIIKGIIVSILKMNTKKGERFLG